MIQSQDTADQKQASSAGLRNLLVPTGHLDNDNLILVLGDWYGTLFRSDVSHHYMPWLLNRRMCQCANASGRRCRQANGTEAWQACPQPQPQPPSISKWTSHAAMGTSGENMALVEW
jgi:hypothetical protein